MKKLFVIAMLAAAGMSACSKEETATTPAEAKYIQVTIQEDAVAGETRTAVDGTETTWVQGDKVAVFLYNGSTTQKSEYSKAAALIIDDFRSGKLGHITLERPEI